MKQRRQTVAVHGTPIHGKPPTLCCPACGNPKQLTAEPTVRPKVTRVRCGHCGWAEYYQLDAQA